MNQQTPPEPPFRLYSDVLSLKDRNTPNFLSTRANKMRVKANPMEVCKGRAVVATIPTLTPVLPSNSLTDRDLLR
jgi:hypothetical protein